MIRTRVKICGITRMEDAMTAVDAGVDAIGFVFYEESPRCIAQEQAAEIAQKLPPFVSKVGLFVDMSSKKIATILNAVSIDLLQFHGVEDPVICRSYGMPYIKAVRMHENIDVHQICDNYFDASALLLDNFISGIPGGTGKTFQWGMVPTNLNKHIILAGGLTAENVSVAISEVSPYAVDVSSGVEMQTGIKDQEKIKNFMQGVYDK